MISVVTFHKNARKKTSHFLLVSLCIVCYAFCTSKSGLVYFKTLKVQHAQKIVHQLNIIDDTLFQKMAEDIDFCEEMISTIIEQKIKVIKVVPQSSIKNLQGRSVEKFPKVLKRKKQFKEDEGGDNTMCDLVEEYANRKAAEAAEKAAEKAAEEARGSALRLFQNGASYELVRASITSITDEELQEIYQKALEK